MIDSLAVDWLQSVIQSQAAFNDDTRAAHARALAKIGSPTRNHDSGPAGGHALPGDLVRSVLPAMDFARTTETFPGTQAGFSIKPGYGDQIADRQRPKVVPSGLIEWIPILSNEWTMPTVTEFNTDTGRYSGFVPTMGVSEETLPPALDSKISQVTWNNTRLIIFTTLSRDVWEDAPRLRVWMDRMASGAIQYFLNKAIITGVGCLTGPQGIALDRGCVTVPKGSTPTGTITSALIDAMWSSLYAGSKQNAVWLANDDTIQAIDQLTTASSATASQEINYISFVPAGRYGQSFPTLKGRPIIPCEQCPVIGQTGDLILWDPSDYILTYRSSQQAASIGAISVSVDTPPGKYWSGSYGLANDAVERRWSGQVPNLYQQDILALYWKMRLDCKSLWTYTSVNRNNETVGNAVVLEAR
jgi:HK97 family phage major capsid protein